MVVVIKNEKKVRVFTNVGDLWEETRQSILSSPRE